MTNLIWELKSLYLDCTSPFQLLDISLLLAKEKIVFYQDNTLFLIVLSILITRLLEIVLILQVEDAF